LKIIKRAEYEGLVKKIKSQQEELEKQIKAFYQKTLEGNKAVTNLLSSKYKNEKALKKLYNDTVGKTIPSLNLQAIDKSIEDIQEKAIILLKGEKQ